MLSFKFNDKLLIKPEYDIKYFGSINLSAEIYFGKKSIGRINSSYFNKDNLNLDHCKLFFNSLSKEYQEFIIDNDWNLYDDEVFLEFYRKFNTSFEEFMDGLFDRLNESKVKLIEDINFDNLICFKSILVVENIESELKIDRNILIEKYIESINYIFCFNNFYILDLEDRRSINRIKEISNILDDTAICNLKNALDECNDRVEILNNVLLNYCEKNNIEYIDKRNKGGCLWIVAGNEIKKQIKLLKEYDIKFTFSKNGGKSSNHRQAWYIK